MEQQNFCPFCPTHEYKAIKDSRAIRDLFSIMIKNKKFKDMVEYFYKENLKVFEAPFTPSLLFSSGFFKSLRMILENILKYLQLNSIYLGGRENQIQFLHSLCHEFMLKDVDTKQYFLPELLSIIHILLNPYSVDHLIKTNYNFMIAIYSFYSLNNFFDWIAKFYEENKIIIKQPDSGFSKFVLHLISFIMRVSFVEPIVSLLSIHKNAQMRYHFLSVNAFYNELCVFSGQMNHKYTIANKLNTLFSFVILIENYETKDRFDQFIHLNIDENAKLNISNFSSFRDFLFITKNDQILQLYNFTKIQKTSSGSSFLSLK